MSTRTSLLLPIGFLGAVLWGYWGAPDASGPQTPSLDSDSRVSRGHSNPRFDDSPHALKTSSPATDRIGDTTDSQGDLTWVDAAEIPKLQAKQAWHQSLHRAASPEWARLSLDQMIERLPEAYRQRAIDYRRELTTLDPEFRRYVCWAPDAPDHVVQTFRQIETEGGMAPGEARIQANQFLGTGHWSRTALDGSNNNVQGQPVTLTWSIAPDGTTVPGLSGTASSASNLRSWLSSIYGTNGGAPDGEPWFFLFEEAFDAISQETGLRFVYQPTDTGSAFSSFFARGSNSRGDIRFGARTLDGNSGTLAFAFAPDYGDVVFDSADSFYDNTGNDSIRFINVLTHELGHALGLDHVCPVNTTKLMEPFAATNFRGLQFDDIFSLQRQYGDPAEVDETRGSNDSFTLAEDLTFTEGLTESRQWLSIDDDIDIDYFRITTSPNREVTVRVIPSNPLNQGSTYLEGPQNGDGSCSAGSAFNPTNQQNLTLELLANDGSTVISSSTLAAAGLTEEILDVALIDGGNHYIRVNGGSANAAQLYTLEWLVEPLPDAPSIKVIGQTLVDESNTPGNALPDPGETIQLAVDIQNTGGLAATDLQGILSGPAGFTGFVTSTSGIEVPAGGSTQLIFTFALDGDCGDTLNLTLDLTATGGYQTSATLPVILGASSSGSILEQNFDGFPVLPTDWTSNASGAAQDWNITTANPDTGPRSAFGDSATAVGEATLTSPVVTLGTGSNLTFRHDFDFESGYDGGVLEASLDDGAWFDLPSASGVGISGGYNDTISGSYSSPISDRDAWSGDSNGYTTVSVDLPDTWQGQDIRFRWLIGSDSSVDDVGWYIDNVNVTSSIADCQSFRPLLSISASGSLLEEGNQASSISGTLSTPLPLAQDIPVTLMTSGTADVGDLSSGLEILLPAGQTSVTFEFFAISDAQAEGIEDLVIFIPDDQPGYAPSQASQISLTIEEPESDFSAWQQLFPGIDPSPEADDDGDRWSNLFEYAFGTDPQNSGSLPAVTSLLTPTDLEINLPNGDVPEDVVIIGETSTDLFQWLTTGVTQTPSGFSVERVGPKRYLRLRATLAPAP